MRKIVLVGGGGHARVLISVIRKTGSFDIVGYTDPEDRGEILGVLRIGGDEALASFLEHYRGCAAVVAVGNVQVSDHREKAFKTLDAIGYELPAIVSMRAVVNEGVTLGKGTVVLDGAVVNTGSRIGECCIINTNATVEHDCEIGDYVHVASGAVLSGGVKVGRHTLIGAGACIVHYREIAERSVIGAGAVVYESLPEVGTYVGSRLRRVK
jgi:sugar O-acyltransferase (sialic acid O-acetyltransferase NeuD family)